MYVDHQNPSRARHMNGAVSRAKSLLKCLQDPFLIQDAELLSRLLRAIEDSCKQAGLLKRGPAPLE
jgi:hypothetical protein